MICLSHLIMFYQLSNHIKFLKKSLSFCYTNKTENYYEYKRLYIFLFEEINIVFNLMCSQKVFFKYKTYAEVYIILNKFLYFFLINKVNNSKLINIEKLHVDCYMIPLFISLEPSFLICCAAKIHFLLCPMLRPIFSKSDSVIEQNVSRQSTPCSTRIFTNSSSANRLMVCWKVPKSNPILLNYYDRNQSCEINNMEINKTHPSIMIKKWSSTKTSAFLYFHFLGGRGHGLNSNKSELFSFF